VSNDDKKLHTTLKRMGMNEIPGIEEVNIFHSDNVINFVHPKGRFCLSPLFWVFLQLHVTVQASIPANTYVVSGHSETKRMLTPILILPQNWAVRPDIQDILPSIVNQLGTYDPIRYLLKLSHIPKFTGPENLANLKRMAEQYKSGDTA